MSSLNSGLCLWAFRGPRFRGINPATLLKASDDLRGAGVVTEFLYLVFCASAVSSCSSSAFCQLEFGLYSFMALARATVFLPRSF